MFKIGDKYRETSNCLGEPIKANLTILEGPRVVQKRNEYYCKCFFVKEVIGPKTGKKIFLRINRFYWLGEDYLENKINTKRMYLKIFKNKEGEKVNEPNPINASFSR